MLWLENLVTLPSSNSTKGVVNRKTRGLSKPSVYPIERQIIHLLFILVVFFISLFQTAEGQSTPSPQTPSPKPSPITNPSPVQTSTVDSEQIPPYLATPRSTLTTFMESMAQAGPFNLEKYSKARSTMDLSNIPVGVRDVQGNLLADELYKILKAAKLPYNKVPDSPDPGTDQILLYRQPSGDSIILVRRPSGGWQFSADTISAVPRMYEVLTHKGKISGMVIPESLQKKFLGLQLWQWLGILALPLISWLFGRLVVICLRPFLKKGLKSFNITLKEEQQKSLLRPVGWFTSSLAWWFSLPILRLPLGLLYILVIIAKIVAAGAAVLASYRLSDTTALYFSMLTSKTQTKFDDMLIPLASRTVKLFITAIAVLFVAQNLNLNVWSLFAGFSVLGAMVALAGKDMVSNLFGSLTVILDRPFHVGDWVAISGVEGTVEDVGFRSTRIRTSYDSVISLPNHLLLTACIDNYGARTYRRYSKKLNIRFDTPTDKIEAFCEGIRELIRSHQYTRKDYFQVYVNDITDFGYQILLYVFWKCPDWSTELQERHRLLVDIHRLAGSLGIEFATPTNMVNLHQWEPPTPREDDFSPSKSLQVKEQARKLSRKLVDAHYQPDDQKQPATPKTNSNDKS